MRIDPKPSVLHIYKDYYPPVRGGIEQCIHWMCDETRSDFHVRVLVASRSRDTLDEVIDGVRVVRAGSFGRVLSLPLAPSFHRLMRRMDSDILHFHMPMPLGEMAYLLPPRPKGMVVVTYHSDIVRPAQRMMGYGPLQRIFLNQANVIMPTSQRYLDSSATLAPHRARCKVVPLGIPLDAWRETEESIAYSRHIHEKARGRTVVVFLGVLRYYKGLPFLLEAMRQLGEQVCLFIGGDGPKRGELEAQAQALGVADRVTFLGDLSETEAVGLLHGGDLFCIPSHLRAEAFCLSQIEAMACGLPVVGTNLATGVPEVNRDGVTGRIVEPASADALAKGLRELIGNPELRKAMGEAAKNRAETLYSSKMMGEELRKVYQGVLDWKKANDDRHGPARTDIHRHGRSRKNGAGGESK